MKKSILLALAFFAMALTMALAQTDSMAEKDYGLGEKLFYNARYSAAISSLNLSDQYPSSIQSKVLYLKIRVLEHLYLRQPHWESDLDHSLEIFSRQTDSAFWTEEKVNEVKRIKLDFEKARSEEVLVYGKSTQDKSNPKKQNEIPGIFLKR